MSNQSTIHSPPTPNTITDCELVRERKYRPVNEFLKQRHPLGDVPGWKACFSARYQDSIVAIVVLSRPVSAMADDGTEISITRFGRRDDRPMNTGSWLIARARTWAELEGFETLTAHAGVAHNFGTVYHATGFSLQCPSCKYLLDDPKDECTKCGSSTVVLADGETWLSKGDNRNTWNDYERRKWVFEL